MIFFFLFLQSFPTSFSPFSPSSSFLFFLFSSSSPFSFSSFYLILLLLFLMFVFHWPLIYYIPTEVCSIYSPQPLPICLLPQIYSSSIFLQKRVDRLGISTKHSITRYNKTRHIPDTKAEQDNPVEGKWSPKKAKESETVPHLCS